MLVIKHIPTDVITKISTMRKNGINITEFIIKCIRLFVIEEVEC